MQLLFTSLGANAKETQVYLTLLELGAQPVSVLARHMHTPRTSMYVTVEKLKELKLLSTFSRKNILYVKATPSAELVHILKKREKKLEATFALLEETLPTLQKREAHPGLTPKVQFFEGKEGVCTLYETILAKEKSFCGFFNPARITEVIGEEFLKIGELPNAHQQKSREIAVDSPLARRYKKTYGSKTHQIKLLPKGISFDADIIITGEKVYMTAFSEEEASGIELWNKPLAQALQVAFDGWWEHLSE